MVVNILNSISSSIRKMGQENNQFKNAATQQNGSISKFIKDISKLFGSQNKQQSDINNSLNELQQTSSITSGKVDQTNNLLQESISIQTNMLSELKNVSSALSGLLKASGQTDGSFLNSMGAVAGGAALGAGVLGSLNLMSNNFNTNSLFGNSSSGGTFSGASSLASSNLSAEEKAILETIAGGESGGRYDIINYVAGGGTPAYFSDFSKHPFEGQKGYTAAGRYQILASNYDIYSKQAGVSDFSPESQDKVALEFAKDVYKRQTGGNLVEDIKNPELHESITNVLKPTWHGIKGGSYLGSAYESFKTQKTPEGDGDVMPQSGAINLQKYSLKPPSHVEGLNSGFKGSLGKFLSDAEASGHSIKIYSGYRSAERQKELWEQAVRKYGSPEAAKKWVAPPGRSRHNFGAAADLQFESESAKQWAHKNASKYGLTFRMGHEPWHIEPANARNMVANNVEEQSFDYDVSSGQSSSVGGESTESPIGLLAGTPFAGLASEILGATKIMSGGLSGLTGMLGLGGNATGEPSTPTSPNIVDNALGLFMPNLASNSVLPNNPLNQDLISSLNKQTEPVAATNIQTAAINSELSKNYSLQQDLKQTASVPKQPSMDNDDNKRNGGTSIYTSSSTVPWHLQLAGRISNDETMKLRGGVFA